jgi:hypothetical protein
MRRSPIPGLLVLALLAALATLVPSATAAKPAPVCNLAPATYKGHPATVNCGAATATLRVGTSTFHFAHGTCQLDTIKADRAAFTLALGTSVATAAGNAGAPLLTLAATSTLAKASVSAFSGGKQRAHGRAVGVSGGALPGHGVFRSVSGKPAISGTWSCNGAIGRLS